MVSGSVCLLLLGLAYGQEPVSVFKAMEIYEDYDPVIEQEHVNYQSTVPVEPAESEQTVPNSSFEAVLYVKSISLGARNDLERLKHNSLEGKLGYERPSIWLNTVENAAVVAIMQPELSTWDETDWEGVKANETREAAEQISE